VPECATTTSPTAAWYWRSTPRTSSGSAVSAKAVNPRRSQNRKDRPVSPDLLSVIEHDLGIREHVLDVDHVALEHRTADRRAALRDVHAFPDQVHVLGSEARGCGDTVHTVHQPRDVAVVGATQTNGPIDHGLQPGINAPASPSP
jgi:hypothetical protein